MPCRIKGSGHSSGTGRKDRTIALRAPGFGQTEGEDHDGRHLERRLHTTEVMAGQDVELRVTARSMTQAWPKRIDDPVGDVPAVLLRLKAAPGALEQLAELARGIDVAVGGGELVVGVVVRRGCAESRVARLSDDVVEASIHEIG